MTRDKRDRKRQRERQRQRQRQREAERGRGRDRERQRRCVLPCSSTLGPSHAMTPHATRTCVVYILKSRRNTASNGTIVSGRGIPTLPLPAPIVKHPFVVFTAVSRSFPLAIFCPAPLRPRRPPRRRSCGRLTRTCCPRGAPSSGLGPTWPSTRPPRCSARPSRCFSCRTAGGSP